jgi:hypothetical protein
LSDTLYEPFYGEEHSNYLNTNDLYSGGRSDEVYDAISEDEGILYEPELSVRSRSMSYQKINSTPKKGMKKRESALKGFVTSYMIEGKTDREDREDRPQDVFRE